MNRRPKIKIMKGRMIFTVLSVIISPILLFFSFLSMISTGIVDYWQHIGHMIIAKFDNNKKKRNE